MRSITPVLVLASAVLFTVSVHAAPANTSDDMDKMIADKGLLTQIDHVRQTVSNKASELVVNAMGLIGVRYKRGGESAETGFDCSGFVRAIYEQSVGLLLPRRAEQQAAATQRIEKNELQPGDLVFFNTMRRAFSHVGIYVGDGKFIHSPRSGAQVRVESMDVSYWQRRFDGARRVQSQDAAAVDALRAQAANAISASTLAPSPFAEFKPGQALTEQQLQAVMQQDGLRR